MKKNIRVLAEIELWVVVDERLGVDARQGIKNTLEQNHDDFEILSIKEDDGNGLRICDECDSEFSEFQIENFKDQFVCGSCLEFLEENEAENKKNEASEHKMESIKNGDYL